MATLPQFVISKNISEGGELNIKTEYSPYLYNAIQTGNLCNRYIFDPRVRHLDIVLKLENGIFTLFIHGSIPCQMLNIIVQNISFNNFVWNLEDETNSFTNGHFRVLSTLIRSNRVGLIGFSLFNFNLNTWYEKCQHYLMELEENNEEEYEQVKNIFADRDMDNFYLSFRENTILTSIGIPLYSNTLSDERVSEEGVRIEATKISTILNRPNTRELIFYNGTKKEFDFVNNYEFEENTDRCVFDTIRDILQGNPNLTYLDIFRTQISDEKYNELNELVELINIQRNGVNPLKYKPSNFSSREEVDMDVDMEEEEEEYVEPEGYETDDIFEGDDDENENEHHGNKGEEDNTDVEDAYDVYLPVVRRQSLE